MSWTCHGSSNAGMVAALKRAGLLSSPALEEAMRAVDRGLFVLPGEAAYQDAPQPLGYCATISAPHMHAVCAELLAGQLRPGARVLDVGSGSGYLTLVFAHMVGGAAGGRVVGVEHISELVAASRGAARQLDWAEDMMARGDLLLVQGDGYAGYPEWGPYDAIHVGAAAPSVPAALVGQLAPGGRLVVPVGPEGGNQHLLVVDRDEQGRVRSRKEMGVMYVPLTSEQQQREKAAVVASWGGPLECERPARASPSPPEPPGRPGPQHRGLSGSGSGTP